MTLLEQIKANLAADRKSANRSSISIHTVIIGECERVHKDLNDEGVIRVLKKLLKDTKDALSYFKSPIAVEAAEFEIKVIESYLPKQLTEYEIKNQVSVARSLGCNDVGAIMGFFKKQHSGRYDGALVSKYAKGFTLIELLIGTAIIGIVGVIFVGAVKGTQDNNLTYGINGFVETRCISGYQFTVGERGHVHQIYDENGRGLPCK